MPAFYAGHHAGAVLLRDRPLFEAALPTKLFEVMAAGRAVVVAARGDSAALVERAGAGIAVAPEDPVALAHALMRLGEDEDGLRSYGQGGRAYVVRHHGRETMVERWAALIENAVTRQRAFL